MNQKIYNLIVEELKNAFKPSKYDDIKKSISRSTVLDQLPWTPVRYDKFKKHIEQELKLSGLDFRGTLEKVTERFDLLYMKKFFGEIWQPTTDQYQYSGWGIVDHINKQNPEAVLDVGCGFNQFKERIHNLTGIDPFNNCADYMVDVLNFNIENESFDHIICFGSLNFNSLEEIELRFKRIVELLKPQGKIYFRANPGISWPNGPYVDIFPWSFEVAYEFSKKYNLHLDTFKQDNNRLFFIFQKKPRKLEQSLLNRYFEKNWNPSYGEGYEERHEYVASQIKDDEWLLDVGCGYNPFKKLVKNVFGIDPAFDNADVKTTIEDFDPPRQFDVATCFGSINFGSREDIKNQIAAMVRCLKPQGRVYWRVNPGHKDHLSEMCKGIDFYPWSFEDLASFAHDFGFVQTNEVREVNDRRLKYPELEIPDHKRFSIRLFAEWHRKS